ncbi:MAG: response regulator, partial [Lachnospiraceae bacterium]|nr:response regulator [Lachnospiraceae bacterium]
MRYQSLFEHMNTGFAYFNVEKDQQDNPSDFVILECNSVFKRNSEITKKNIIGERASQLFDVKEEWCRTIFNNLKKVSSTGEPLHFEIYMKKCHKYISFSIYCPHEGNLELISCDITEFKDIIELKRISMYFSARFINTPTGKINEEINNALYEIKHFYDAEFCCIFQYDEDINTFSCSNQSIMEWKEIPKMYQQMKLDEFDWLLNRIKNDEIVKIINSDELPEEAFKEKEYFKHLGYKSMVFLPIIYEDKILGIIGLATLNYEKIWTSEQIDLLKIICTIFASAIKRKIMDEKLQDKIVKLVKLKEVLKDSEEKYRKLMFSIQDAVIMLDNNGMVVNWNKAAEEMFGYTFKEVEGQSLHKLIVPPEIYVRAEENFEKFKHTGEGRLINKVTEIHAVKKDGSKFIAEVSVSAIKLKGMNHAVGIVRDITERRQTQQKLLDSMDAAETANKAKSQFLANMSHEIRTPMNGIIGFLDLLSKTELDNRQEDYIREIKTASESLLALINDLLDFSKIEANKLELEHISFDIRKLIEEITSSFSLRAYSKGIEIHTWIDNSIPLSAIGDPGKLRQVLENLIGNAVKFTAKGKVVITAKLVSITMDKTEILFSVEDTGIGITDQDIQKLFEPFTQVDASTTRKYGGTGLGLSICEKIVEMMSGRITVKSVFGSGATFSFNISFDNAKEEQEEIAEEVENLKGLKILVADQSSTTREIVKYYLEGAGCIVIEADNSEKIIEQLRVNSITDNKIKVALLSVDMPDQNCFDLAEKIKAEESIKDTILNLITYYVNPCDKKMPAEKGISELIYKPIFRNDLYNCILVSIGKIDKNQLRITKVHIPADVIFDEYQKKNTRILLVEDNVTNQKLVANILRNASLSFDAKENGNEALKALEVRDYDLVLMDCQMPELDGYEATKQIRLNEEGKSHIPIIAMTANVLKSDIEKCLKTGMDDYISKPFRANDLLEIIAKWLKKEDNKSKNVITAPMHPLSMENLSDEVLVD